MKLRLVMLAVAACFAFACEINGQSPKGRKSAAKSPSDIALEEFGKVFTARSKPDQAYFQKLIGAGMTFLVEHPTHPRAGDVVRELGSYAGALRDRATVPFRPVYVSLLRYQLVNYTYMTGLSDAAKAAVAAVDASLSDYEARAIPNQSNIAALREKIDTLAALPAAGDFLIEREQSYSEILMYSRNPARGEAHLAKLAEHPDARVAAWASDELKLVELRKTPYELTFTALDGKDVDIAKLRGKVVALVFLSATDNASPRFIAGLRDLYSAYRRPGLEIIAVACDNDSERERVTKFVKDQRVSWPVYYDGTGPENSVSSKLLVRRLPTVALIDKKGMLVTHSARPDQLGEQIAWLLDVKPANSAPPEMPAEPAGGSRKRR